MYVKVIINTYISKIIKDDKDIKNWCMKVYNC